MIRKAILARGLYGEYGSRSVYGIMVTGSLWSDGKKDRLREEDVDLYVTAMDLADFYEEHQGECFYCDTVMELVGNRISNPDAVSIERMDETKSHTVDNVVLVCMECNHTRGHTPHEIMVEHGIAFKTKMWRYCKGCEGVIYYDQFRTYMRRNRLVRRSRCDPCRKLQDRIRHAQ